jgi:DNA mismatch repair protein MutL
MVAREPAAPFTDTRPVVVHDEMVATSTPQATVASAPAIAPFLTPIGQLFDLYILCESHDGQEPRFVVIDQHAAHERILFEELRQQYLSRRVAGQTLLFPLMVELDPVQIELVEHHGQELTKLGLTIEPFGEATYVIKAVPALLVHVEAAEILADFLRLLGDHPPSGEHKATDNHSGRLDALFASMACKSAIKAGRQMEAAEIKELLQKLQRSNAFSHCPHGRPVVKTFTPAEIKKWFHRT